jgi:large subunit ribosomal protein L21
MDTFAALFCACRFQMRMFGNRYEGMAECDCIQKESIFMYAVIETGGKQYRVQEGDVVFLERLQAEVDSEVVFDKILAVCGDEIMSFGAPYLTDKRVRATVLSHGKDKKITIYKFKSKKGYRRKQGHRQPHTKVRIEKIEA